MAAARTCARRVRRLGGVPRRPAGGRRVAAAAPRASAAAGGGVAGVAAALTNAFPVWVAAGAALGVVHPPALTWFAGPLIPPALALVSLGMGLTTEAKDFEGALRQPRSLALGVALQYVVMPSLGFVIGRLMGLPTPYAVGLILVSCCPGGTASNIVSLLARSNVALSVVMTSASTALAAIMTPLLTSALAGTLVAVDAAGLLISTLQVVVIPVVAGLALQKLAPRAVTAVKFACPLFAVVVVALICGSIIAQNAAAVCSAGVPLLASVAVLHIGGFALGYGIPALVGTAERDRRTIAIEVGMQNSALGTVLALGNFADPLTAVPCAISATMHSCIGSALAGYWRLNAK